jgi:hypothetical protein
MLVFVTFSINIFDIAFTGSVETEKNCDSKVSADIFIESVKDILILVNVTDSAEPTIIQERITQAISLCNNLTVLLEKVTVNLFITLPALIP